MFNFSLAMFRNLSAWGEYIVWQLLIGIIGFLCKQNFYNPTPLTHFLSQVIWPWEEIGEFFNPRKMSLNFFLHSLSWSSSQCLWQHDELIWIAKTVTSQSWVRMGTVVQSRRNSSATERRKMLQPKKMQHILLFQLSYFKVGRIFGDPSSAPWHSKLEPPSWSLQLADSSARSNINQPVPRRSQTFLFFLHIYF